jgi:hypothetical protein
MTLTMVTIFHRSATSARWVDMATKKDTDTKSPWRAEHLAYRLPADVLARLDQLAAAMSAKHPTFGFRWSRADVARAAMLAGLPGMEREYGIAPPAALQSAPVETPPPKRGRRRHELAGPPAAPEQKGGKPTKAKK